MNLAATNASPSAIEAAPAASAPVPMFSGSADCVTPPAQHQGPICDDLRSSCRTRPLTLRQTMVRQRIEALDWERARADVRPFLERERDIAMVTAETLGSLLGARAQ